MKKILKIMTMIAIILFLHESTEITGARFENYQINTKIMQSSDYNIFDYMNCTISGNIVTIKEPVKIDGNRFDNKFCNFIFPKNYIFKVSDDFRIGENVFEFYNFDNLSISNLNINGKLRRSGENFYNDDILLNTSNDWNNLNQAIWIRDSKNVNLNNVNSINSTGCGICIKRVDEVSVINCSVRNSYQHGIFVGNVRKKVLISNCNCTAFGDLDYETNIKIGGIGILVSESENPIISNCIINGFEDTGTKTEGCNHVRYINNTIKNFGKDGIKVQGYGDKVVNINDCIVKGNIVDTRFNGRKDGSSYILFHEVSNGIIEDNTILKSVKNNTMCDDGIRVNMLNGTQASNIKIINNIVNTGTNSPSLNIIGNNESSVNNIIVSGNTFGTHIICDKVNEININNNTLDCLTLEENKYMIYLLNSSVVEVLKNKFVGISSNDYAIYVQKDSCESLIIDNVN
ncbi:right-handed parallel beta-helix repeat-containing protein [Clostridium sp.]|uniref:right-handed parallel beta-helix repeat-containing protein n=1 Tax=Clostridium sp. TaxID=1506 RepID=UPI00260947B5|nr:right-handed parallel beta-helix repeat-containing protein [Clostridium sp.]